MAVDPKADPTFSKAASLIDRYQDRFSEKVSVSATTTLNTALATTIAATDAGVTIISDGTLQYNPAGAADADSAFLPTVYTVHGGQTVLETLQLFAGAAVDVSVIIFEVTS